jgi:hypothetical protein
MPSVTDLRAERGSSEVTTSTAGRMAGGAISELRKSICLKQARQSERNRVRLSLLAFYLSLPHFDF